MTDSERELETLENQVPALSADAVNKAYSTALKTGSVYVSRQSENGGWGVFEVFSNGTRKFIKDIDSPSYKPAGTTFQIP